MSLWSRITEWLIARDRTILVVVALVTAFLGWWATRIQTDHRPGNFLDEQSEVVQDYERLSDLFDPNQDVLFVVFPNRDPRDPTFLARLDSLTRWIQRQVGVTTALSLTNAPYLVRSGDSLDAVAVFDPTLPDSTLIRRVEDLRYVRGLLLSENGTAPAIIIRIEREFNNTPERVDLVRAIQLESRRLDDGVALAGFPYIRSMYGERVTREAPLFTLLALAISLVMLYVAFRSRRAILLPTIVVSLGIVWTVGLIALFRHRLNIVTSVLPALLVIIGTANVIHLLTKFYDRYAVLGDRREAIEDTMRIVGLATFLASLTTAIGFLVLELSGSSLLAAFGSFAAAGVAILYVLSVTLIPIALIHLAPPDPERLRIATDKRLAAMLDGVARFTRRHSARVLVGAALFILVGVIGLGRVSSNIFVFSDFYEDDPLRTDLRVFEDLYGGALPMEVVIVSPSEGQFRSISAVRRLEQLQTQLGSLEGVGQTYSMADLLKLANQAYFGGHPAAFRLPSRYELPFLQTALRDLAGSQNADGIVSKLPLFADSTFAATRIYLGVRDVGTDQMNILADSAVGLATALFPADQFEVFATGTAIKSTRSGESLVSNLRGSLLVALGAVSLIMALMFRSTRLTLISVFPNIVPMLIVGGAMGFAGIVLKPSTALIFPLSFGIAVDNTIHFLAKYRMVLAAGVPRDEAVTITLRETGKAILFTSLILMGGFLIFTLSSFGGTVSLGALTAFTLFVSLLANLILLPALLFRYGQAEPPVSLQPVGHKSESPAVSR